MNEKLKELAEQSGFYFYDLHDIVGEDLGESVEADSWSAIEKFAELIIKECAEYLRTTDFSEVACGPNAVAESAADDLLNLFGIEDEGHS